LCPTTPSWSGRAPRGRHGSKSAGGSASINPHGSTLPDGIKDEWALLETAISIEGRLEKEIGPGGYHLYKSRSIESKGGMSAIGKAVKA